jgi:hypothetical protein
MNAATFIYLASVLDNLHGALVVLTILLVTGLTVSPIALIEIEIEEKEKFWAHIRKVIWALSISVLLLIFIPKKDTVYLMAAASVGQQIIESPEVKEVNSKILNIINKKLDEMGGK